MKRLITAILAAAGMTLLSGCAATELGDRAIIQAAAVDWDNGEYTVSALLFSSGGSSSEGIDASGENVIKVSGSGKTFAQAVDNISLNDGKEIYMSENKLLIIGGGFAQADLTPVLETLTRDMRCSLNMLVCCAEDPELLTDMHFTEGITSAEKPVSMIENAYRSGSSPRAYLIDLLNDAAAGRSTLIPMFQSAWNGYGMTTDEEGETAELSGSRYLYCGRLTQRLDSAETAGAMLLEGLSDKALLTFEHGGREHSCEAYSVRVKRLDTGEIKLSAKLRRRNGEALPEELKTAALGELDSMIRLALEIRHTATADS